MPVFLIFLITFFMFAKLSYATDKNLQLGKKQIKVVQRVLNTFGYDAGEIDGVSGEKTISAIDRFYAEKGWRFDGYLSKNEFDYFRRFLWRNERIKSPVNAPLIISDFQSPFGVNGRRRSHSHQGIDITGPIGQPILAVADGIVLEATVEKCWGPTIAIDHGRSIDGRKLIALYGHVGEMIVVKGDYVNRGQLIARLGSNEKNFKCIGGVRHLHFQLGQKYRGKNQKGTAWGHTYFLYDGGKAINPHKLWANGPNWVTCFKNGKKYKNGTLTYPVPCTN